MDTGSGQSSVSHVVPPWRSARPVDISSHRTSAETGSLEHRASAAAAADDDDDDDDAAAAYDDDDDNVPIQQST